MSDGQLALNTNLVSPGLFLKDSNGDSVKIGPVHVGTTAPNVTPGAGGQAGNSKGEQWLDTSSSRYVFKIWDGTAWRSEDGEFVNTSGDTMTGALGIIAGTAAAPGVFFSGDADTGLYSPAADTLAFVEGGVEAARIDSNGRFLVGTSSARGGAHTIEGIDYGGSSVTLVRDQANSEPPIITLGKTRGTAIGANTIVVANDFLGIIDFKGADGANLQSGAYISAFVDGTPGTNDMPGRLMFSTTADGTSSPTERMRIDNRGNVFFNNSTPTSTIWATDNAVFKTGYVGSNGAFGMDIVGNGYRNTAGGWTSLNQDGNIGRSIIGLRPTANGGTIVFGADNLTTGTQPTIQMQVDGGGVSTYGASTKYTAPIDSATAVTLTAASIIDGIRSGTPTASINYTLPTGTNIDAAFQDLAAGQSFEWSVINRASVTFNITLVANTTHTVSGNMVTGPASSGRFLTRKTAANTFVTYRIG